MAGFEPTTRAASSWRTRAGLVLVVVAAAGALVGVAGASPTTSTTDVAFVPLTVPHKVLNNTTIAANAVNSSVYSGASTTVPTDATTVQLSVSAKGVKGGTLSFYPADNPAGSSDTLSYPVGSGVVTATLKENIGLSNKISIKNTSTGSASVTVTITGYSTQVTAGDISGTGGTAGQVLTDNGAGGASWSDIGRVYSFSGGFSVSPVSGSNVNIATLSVPAGAYLVNAAGTFQSGAGRSFANCQLNSPHSVPAQYVFVVADAADVNDTPIVLEGVISTAGGGTITVTCSGTASAQAGNVNLTALRVGNASGAVITGMRQVAAPRLSGKGLPVRK